MELEPVSVVIPSWNGASILRPTLEHLIRLEGLDFEVLVVDHGRLNRESETLVKEFSSLDPRVKYLGLDTQLGYAGAVNYGTERAKHHLVAVLCNDVLVDKNWLAELVKVFAQRRAAGRIPVVTSLVRRPGFDQPLSAKLNLWGRIVTIGERPARAEDYIPFFPDGSAFLFDRNFLGVPFDAEYFLYQEDVSIGWRSWLMGEEVVLAPRSNALNADGGTTRRTPYRTAFYTERNRWLNYFLFFSLSTLWRVLPLLWADAALKLVVGSNRRAKLHAWLWLLLHPRKILKKRRAKQKLRRRPDSEIVSLISFLYADHGMAARLNGLIKSYIRFTGIR